MTLMIYDTRNRGKREFVPRKEEEVLVYVCGPTVYAPAHLGHARSYVIFDVVRRYLEFLGRKVKVVQNFTDLEDSITRTAKTHGIPPLELARMYAASFLRDMDDLGVLRAAAYPKVSENIPATIETISALITKGYAYVADGDVFFRVSKAKSLGMLSHRDVKAMMVDDVSAKTGRENPLDFALWRKAKGDDPSWPSPWGEGRPGWHIECFVMSTRHLGPKIDIHCGGLDLVFPHHESEAMVSEAFVQGDWCNFWLHNAFVTLEQEKMSKSLGNFVILRELLDSHKPEAVRLCMLKEHYRKNVEYDRDCFKRTEGELARVYEAIRICRTANGEPLGHKIETLARSSRSRFLKAMDDDFDTADAVQVMMQLTEAVHELDHLSKGEGAMLASVYDDIGRILGLFRS